MRHVCTCLFRLERFDRNFVTQYFCISWLCRSFASLSDMANEIDVQVASNRYMFLLKTWVGFFQVNFFIYIWLTNLITKLNISCLLCPCLMAWTCFTFLQAKGRKCSHGYSHLSGQAWARCQGMPRSLMNPYSSQRRNRMNSAFANLEMLFI